MPRADTGKKTLNKRVDAIAKEFFASIDADGVTQGYAGYQLLAVRAMFEGGEAVSRKLVRPVGLKLPLPLQFSLMEGEFIDNQWNTILANGNRVVQGVEFNPKTRIREAYWMHAEHPGDTYMAASGAAFERVRVPADEVRVMMEAQRPGQIRGVPWIAPILVRSKLLDDYEDAERQRKRIESSLTAVVKSSVMTGEASEGQGPSLFPTMTDANGDLIEAIEAGMVAYTRDSAGIEMMKPAEATGFPAYKRSELQSIAAGGRSTYELASGDLSQTNFSSIQFGTLGYRGMHDVIRATIVIPHLEWIWREMIDMAIVTGRLPVGTPYGVKHHCPPWLPIDPVKQADANKTMMRTGEKSLYEIVTAGGKDFEEHMAEIAASNKLVDRYGLVFDSDPRRTDGRGVNQLDAASIMEPEDALSNPARNPDTSPDAGSGDTDTDASSTQA